MSKEKNIGVLSKVGYGLGDLGCNLIYTTAGSFITLYYTDSVLLSAAFVGTMMLIARLLDGVSDIVMGVVIDHTNTKIGKARPWLFISTIPLIISFILLFNVPNSLGISGKQIYAVLTYIFMAVICYTAVNLSYSTLCTLMSPDSNARVSLSSFRMLFSFIAIMLINGLTGSLISKFGGGQEGFSKMAIIYGVIAFVCIMITALTSKEYNIENKNKVNEKFSKEVSKKAVRSLLTNKYTWICTLGFVFNWLILSLNGAVMIYYARDVLGNIALMGILSVTSMGPSIIMLSFVPKCAFKFGKRKMLIFGGVFLIIGYGLISIVPTVIPVIIIGNLLRGIGCAFLNTLLFASVPDIADYISIRENKNVAGLTNSITSFGMKVGTGIGAAILGWVLAWGGYSAELANSFMPQSEKTILAERMCFSIIPFVIAIIVLVLVMFLDVEKKLNDLRNSVEVNK